MKSEIYHRLVLIPLVILLAQAACVQKQPAQKTPARNREEEKEMLLRVNKYLVQKDVELIEAYATRRNWNMEVTETGLFYEIYEKTDGATVKEGDQVKILYEVRLLDGSTCYTSEKDGPKNFILGRSQEISGLEQGLAMMKEGEKARFIIPPHLAYGLIGDENRIPARSIIVYLVELAQIN
jgi:FKBP-type peptidyl-prolyl cis-trans isomerase